MDNTHGTNIKMSSTAGMRKSAIIFRDDSANYLYVCFHCDQMLNNINDTVQHIESHFQVNNVLLDPFIKNESEDKLVDCSGIIPESVDIKFEIIESYELEHSFVSTKFEGINDNLQQIEVVDVKENPSRSDDIANVKPKRKRKKSAETSVPSYRCHKCHKNFRTSMQLKSHLKSHKKDYALQSYKCKECDCYYKNGLELRFHVLEVHLMEKKFYCNACSAGFDVLQKDKFVKHLNQHNRSKLWTHIVDGIYLQSNDFTKFEEMNSFTDQEYACEFCTQRYYIECNLDVHMKSVHSGQRRLQCGQCDSLFVTPKYYFAHQMEHQRVGSNILERDDKEVIADFEEFCQTFGDERIIFDETQSSDRSYRCLICNTTYEKIYDIRSHIRKQHLYKLFPPPPEEKKVFICDICDLRLKSKAGIESHLMIHTNSKPHPCKICGKRFRQKSDKTVHERQHTGERPYQCHQCGKNFVSRGVLTAHQTHHDDSTYPCPTCGKVFNRPCRYRAHMETHRQERNFKCTICSKSFTTRLYLTRHKSTHSERKHKCRFCDSEFNTGDGRRQHERFKHRHATS